MCDKKYLTGTRIEDIIGKKFGRWTVISLDVDKYNLDREKVINKEIEKQAIYWICECSCGTIRSVSGASIRNNKSNSCGCLQKEIVASMTKEVNKYDICGEYARIWNPSNEHFTIIDKTYLNEVLKFRWNVGKNGYWTSGGKGENRGKQIKLHRFIYSLSSGEGCRKDMVVDHLNRNRSDNRINNLEMKSTADNNRNTSKKITNKSGKQGVMWRKNRCRWVAYIMYNGKTKTRTFLNYDDAVSERIKMEREFGFIGE